VNIAVTGPEKFRIASEKKLAIDRENWVNSIERAISLNTKSGNSHFTIGPDDRPMPEEVYTAYIKAGWNIVATENDGHFYTFS